MDEHRRHYRTALAAAHLALQARQYRLALDHVTTAVRHANAISRGHQSKAMIALNRTRAAAMHAHG